MNKHVILCDLYIFSLSLLQCGISTCWFQYNGLIAVDLLCLMSVNSGQWMVLIDAAKGSSTCPPDLSKYRADFVAVSFYKVVMLYLCKLS